MKKRRRKRPATLARKLRAATRNARHRFTVPLIRAAVWCISRLPHGFALGLGRMLGLMGFMLGGARRRRAVQQLERSGVAPDRAAATQLARRVFENAGMYALELPNAMYWPHERVRDLIRYEGFEQRNAIENGGRGVVFAICHMASWELLALSYRLYFDRPIHVAMTTSSNPNLTDWLQEIRRRFGCEPLHDQGRGLAFVRQLRQGNDIALLCDQDSKKYRGVFVNFFGRPARTPEGPALLARKLGTPIVPGAVRRDTADPKRLIAMMGAPIAPDPALDEAADILRMTQAYTKTFEDWIRASPQDWVWMHDRWRRQPH